MRKWLCMFCQCTRVMDQVVQWGGWWKEFPGRAWSVRFTLADADHDTWIFIPATTTRCHCTWFRIHSPSRRYSKHKRGWKWLLTANLLPHYDNESHHYIVVPLLSKSNHPLQSSSYYKTFPDEYKSSFSSSAYHLQSNLILVPPPRAKDPLVVENKHNKHKGQQWWLTIYLHNPRQDGLVFR